MCSVSADCAGDFSIDSLRIAEDPYVPTVLFYRHSQWITLEYNENVDFFGDENKDFDDVLR